MTKILAMIGFSVLVMVAAAGGSWLVQNKLLTGTGHGGHGGHGGAHGASSHSTSGESSEGDEAAADAAVESSHESSAGEGVSALADASTPSGTSSGVGDGANPAGSARLPIPVRPREMSVEELLRYGMGIKEREAQVKLQEEMLQKRRVQHQLAQADIEGERKEVDGLRVQVADQLKQAEKLIEKLKEVRSQLLQDQNEAAEKMQQIKHERVEIDIEHMDNTKRLSQWIQSMDPEKAAEVLKSMANDGPEQQGIAVQILRNLEEREAAKILSAIDDPKLVQQLIEKFRNLKRLPPKTADKR